jgi:hypothetical protein
MCFAEIIFDTVWNGPLPNNTNRGNFDKVLFSRLLRTNYSRYHSACDTRWSGTDRKKIHVKAIWTVRQYSEGR